MLISNSMLKYQNARGEEQLGKKEPRRAIQKGMPPMEKRCYMNTAFVIESQRDARKLVKTKSSGGNV